ncbi:cobalamin binding intrinsic factor-like isoform X1 [Rhinatrema bivittatum]|uniref:cobalamin binding intrinsic factor-like isoform X1 n=1 Tax=Rhinatrema bivittatum TaxID=194408 RepID=UPI0011266BC8|nr:cobalamin binding intrinsic factor-like isoform X1 [Rhinatrema bivittatum]
MLHPGSAGKIPRMLPLPLCVLLLLAVCTQDVSSALCSVPANQQSLVTALLHQMIRSVGANVAPNPSVLLAMNLAGKPDVTAEKLLVQQLKDDAVQKLVNEQTFTSGQVALYILALRSSCENPFKVSALGKTIDLVFVLEGQLKAEVAHIEKYQSPLTTYYQVALDILALCEEGSEAAHPAAESLAKASLNNQPGSSFSVDTASVAVLALTCVFNGKLATDAGTMVDVSGQMRSRVKEALSVLTAGILKAQKSDGVIGDIYSTGLAAQALTAVSDIYPVSDWNCPMTMAQVIAGIPKDTFFLPMAASQVLPFLKGKTYLDVSSICVPENALQQSRAPWVSLSPLSTASLGAATTKPIGSFTVALFHLKKVWELTGPRTRSTSWPSLASTEGRRAGGFRTFRHIDISLLATDLRLHDRAHLRPLLSSPSNVTRLQLRCGGPGIKSKIQSLPLAPGQSSPFF